MDLLEKFVQDTKWLSQHIELKITLSDNDKVVYHFILDEGTPNKREQKAIVLWFRDMGVISDVYLEEKALGVFQMHFMAEKEHIGYSFIVNREKFNEMLQIFRTQKMSSKDVIENVKLLSKSQPVEQSQLPDEQVPLVPKINQEKRILIFNGKHTKEIPGNQWILCKAVFEKEVSDWVLETDVITHFNREGKQSFADARRLLNERIERELGITELLEYKSSKVRMNPEVLKKLTHS